MHCTTVAASCSSMTGAKELLGTSGRLRLWKGLETINSVFPLGAGPMTTISHDYNLP
jgi:hypothetical protein